MFQINGSSFTEISSRGHDSVDVTNSHSLDTSI